MANKKYRPGMNCEKTGKYSRYNADGKCVGEDIDVEKGRRFPPAQEEGCYYKEPVSYTHLTLPTILRV